MSGITYLGAETKQLDAHWEQKSDTTCIPFHIYDMLNDINEIILNCNSALSEADMNPISYSSQANEIEKLAEALGCMNRYISAVPSQLNERIDKPLYEGFDKHATETISRIHMEDFKTKNTLGLHESWAAAGGGYAYSGTRLREDLCFADFLGNNVGKGTGNGYASSTPTDCVQEFADLFKADYEAAKSAGSLDGSKIKNLDDYLGNIAKMGEFDHKMDQPFKSFISGLLDITIIKPLIECATGYDLITGEDLTDFELTMKGVFAVVDIFTLGTAVIATKGLEVGGKTALKLAGKTVLTTMASDATAYTVGYISNQAGAPLPITMLLSMGSGIAVSKVAGKYLFKNAGGKLLGECKVPGERVNANFGENIKDVLSKYNISIDEFNDLRLKKVANLTDSEKAMLKSIRESIPMPDSTTEMQKAIPQGDIQKYLDGTYNQVGGYVTRATDVTQLTKYKDFYDSLRLGYPGNKFHPVKDDTLGVIVFKTPEAKKFKIPYSKEMGGTTLEKQPFMGNGFAKAKNGQIIPEYKSDQFLKITNGSELYEISQNGTKKLRAVYDGKLKRFIEIK